MIEVQESDRMMGTLTVFLAMVTYDFIAASSLPQVSPRLQRALHLLMACARSVLVA